MQITGNQYIVDDIWHMNMKTVLNQLKELSYMKYNSFTKFNEFYDIDYLTLTYIKFANVYDLSWRRNTYYALKYKPCSDGWRDNIYHDIIIFKMHYNLNFLI